MTTTTTLTASELIDLSIAEDRTVTEYPENHDEFVTIEEALYAECEDNTDVSGNGFSGPEARGYIDFWGTDEDGNTWRVNLVRAPK